MGGGALGQAIASRAARMSSEAKPNFLIASRSGASAPGLSTPVLPIPEALAQASVVILAIPCSAYPTFLEEHGHRLQGEWGGRPSPGKMNFVVYWPDRLTQCCAGRVVVDASNPTPAEARSLLGPGVASVAEYLQEQLPASTVVKAFTDTGG